MSGGPNSSSPMIRFEQVAKTFPGSDTPAITGLSFDVAEGTILTLVGPSGCGKTTALRLINRLIEPTSGRILINGEDAAGRPAHQLRLGIGYVIQQAGLFPHRTIAQNIATVPTLLGWDKAKTSARVAELIDLVGLDPAMARRYPSELSGGQQQRVGVARALAADPPVLLMDEPFGAVDPIVRARLQDELLGLQEQVRKTVIFVTHDIDEAIKLGDSIAILNVGGVLEQYGTPEAILRAPANDFVEQFLGGERGLKRLALIPVSSVPMKQGPVVPSNADAETAAKVAAEHDVDWVGVLEGGDVLGWYSIEQYGDGRPKPFAVRLSPEESLRAALDEIVTARTPVAVVCEGGRYLGMITLEDIRQEIAR